METFIKVVAIWSTIDAILGFLIVLGTNDQETKNKYAMAFVQNLIYSIWGWAILLNG